MMRWIVGTMAMIVLAPVAAAAPPTTTAPDEPAVVADRLPPLAGGVLSTARLVDLPDGVMVRAEGLAIRTTNIEQARRQVPEDIREQAAGLDFLLADQLATEPLLERAARAWATTRPDEADASSVELYLQSVVASVRVSDQEARAFYEASEEMFRGAEFGQVRKYILRFLTEQKQRRAVDDHIRTLGSRMGVEVSRRWAETQAAAVRTAPVDSVRWSGRPTLVIFGGACCGPDPSEPLAAALADDCGDRANVVHISTRIDPVTTMRYRVWSPPAAVLHDGGGSEVERWAGYLPERLIRARLKALDAIAERREPGP